MSLENRQSKPTTTESIITKESSQLVLECLYQQGIDIYKQNPHRLRKEIAQAKSEIDKFIRANLQIQAISPKLTLDQLNNLEPAKLLQVRNLVLAEFKKDRELELDGKYLPLAQIVGYINVITANIFGRLNQQIDMDLPQIKTPYLRIKILNILKSVNTGVKQEEIKAKILELLNLKNVPNSESLANQWFNLFVEINRPLNELYTSHVQNMDFNNKMRGLALKATKDNPFLLRELKDQTFQWKGERLDTAIEGQSSEPNRSIIELISNAIDAGSQKLTTTPEENKIQVSIRQNSYTVTDSGTGMNPFVIMEKFTPPKISGKSGSETVGRFGVGFYTALSHLKKSSDSVEVISNDGQNTWLIKFRIHEKTQEIFSHYEKLEPNHPKYLSQQGTSIQVHTQDFDAKDAKLLASKLLSSNSYSSIILTDESIKSETNNDEIIKPILLNNLEDKQINQLNDTKIIYSLERSNSCRVSVMIRGVEIQSINLHNQLNLPSSLALDLPLECTIPESRSELEIDAIAVTKLKQIVDQVVGLQIQPESKVTLCNALYPVLEVLQKNNSSSFKASNIAIYCQQKFSESIKIKNLLPNDPKLQALDVQNSVYANPGLVQKNITNVEGIASCKDWQSSNFKLYLAPFKEGPDPIIVLEDSKTIFLDREVYDRLKDSPAALNSYFDNLDHSGNVKTEQSLGKIKPIQNEDVTISKANTYKLPIDAAAKLDSQILETLEDSIPENEPIDIHIQEIINISTDGPDLDPQQKLIELQSKSKLNNYLNFLLNNPTLEGFYNILPENTDEYNRGDIKKIIQEHGGDFAKYFRQRLKTKIELELTWFLEGQLRSKTEYGEEYEIGTPDPKSYPDKETTKRLLEAITNENLLNYFLKKNKKLLRLFNKKGWWIFLIDNMKDFTLFTDKIPTVDRIVRSPETIKVLEMFSIHGHKNYNFSIDHDLTQVLVALGPSNIQSEIINKLNESQAGYFVKIFKFLFTNYESSLSEYKDNEYGIGEVQIDIQSKPFKYLQNLISLFSAGFGGNCNEDWLAWKLTNIFSLERDRQHNVTSIANSRDYSSLPADIRGYVIYIFEGGEILPNRNLHEDPTRQENYEVELTISSLVTAKRNRNSAVSKFEGSSSELQTLVGEVNQGVDPSKAIRDINHASFNQKANGGLLWMREAFQNAKDAIVVSNPNTSKTPTIEVKVFRQTDESGVQNLITEIHDPAGMDLNKVINYLLIPGESDKIGDDRTTGEKGQGFFTIFKDAKAVNIKTSTGNGIVNYINITPILDENGKTIDFLVKESQIQEEFKGTILQQVSSTNIPEVQAAVCKGAAISYGGLLDKNTVRVKFGEQTINKSRKTLASKEISEMGELKVIQANENALTQGGLYIKDLNNEVLDLIPYTIKKDLLQVGIVLDLPRSIRLNNARDDVIASQKEQLQQMLSQHIPSLALQAYLQMYASGDIEIHNIPYDYFQTKAGARSRSVPQRILDDSKKLGSADFDFTQYAGNPDHLFRLMSVIPVFESGETKLSLNQVAKISIETPENLPANLPKNILQRIEAAKNKKVEDQFNIQQAKEEFGVESATIMNDTVLAKLPNTHEKGVYQAFDFVFEEVLQLLGSPDVSRTYYYEIGSSVAHALIDGSQIGFNLYFSDQWQNLKKIIENNLDISHPTVQNFLEFMVTTITHERQHNLENEDHLSHNQSFFDHQRGLIMQIIKNKEADLQGIFKQLHSFDPVLTPAKDLITQ